MYTKKEITEKYEVTRTTLHNWKTTKPNLYNLLLNSDGSNNQVRELNIVLEKYSKTIRCNFFLEEIEYILNFDIEKNFNEIEKLDTLFIESTSSDIKQNSEFILNIYQKIKSLNIVERYIFITRIKSVKKQKMKNSETQSVIKHYFREFLVEI